MVRIFSLKYLVRIVFSTIVSNNFVIIIDYHSVTATECIVTVLDCTGAVVLHVRDDSYA